MATFAAAARFTRVIRMGREEQVPETLLARLGLQPATIGNSA
jgi:hypothetical protein